MDHIDSGGRLLKMGDRVVFLDATEDLLRGLPASDREAIRAQVGKEMAVEGLNEYGYVELEFVDMEDAIHSIWVEPDCRKKSDWRNRAEGSTVGGRIDPGVQGP